MNQLILDAAHAHAKRDYPKESCGLVVILDGVEQYVPCRNVAKQNDEFEIDPRDWISAENAGTILRIVHSHCDWSPVPTMTDLVACEQHGKPWLIVAYPMGTHYEFAPSGYRAPLLGREFKYGILDCYTLARDYYRERLGITLPDFPRLEEGWWEGPDGPNLFIDYYKEAGFVDVPKETMRPHDLLLMHWTGRTVHHVAICTDANRILHHVRGQLSRDEFYGELWQRCTRKVIRHNSLM